MRWRPRRRPAEAAEAAGPGDVRQMAVAVLLAGLRDDEPGISLLLDGLQAPELAAVALEVACYAGLVWRLTPGHQVAVHEGLVLRALELAAEG
jgi:hypothetical protein